MSQENIPNDQNKSVFKNSPWGIFSIASGLIGITFFGIGLPKLIFLLIGTIFGVIGVRKDQKKSPSKAGLWINILPLLIGGLFLVMLFLIYSYCGPLGC